MRLDLLHKRLRIVLPGVYNLKKKKTPHDNSATVWLPPPSPSVGGVIGTNVTRRTGEQLVSAHEIRTRNAFVFLTDS